MTTAILRKSSSESDSLNQQVYRSLSDLSTDMNPVSSNGNRKSGERKYRTSFTSTPHLNTNYYKNHRRNFSQSPRLNNGCSNGIESEVTSGQQASASKPEDKNTEKKKKRNIFVRLVSRKGKRTARSEQITCTGKNKEQPTSNLTQIKQPHLRSNILTSGLTEGIKSSDYSGQHIGQPRRFMSDMNLYVPKSVKNLSTSAALEGHFIDESFSFLTDENIVMFSGSKHRIANGEFMLSQKSFSTGFTSEFSLPDAKYSPQSEINHFYDNNFHSVKINESQTSGTSYEEIENDAESPDLAVLRHQLHLRRAGISKPTLHVKDSFRSQALMLKSSDTKDKDVLY